LAESQDSGWQTGPYDLSETRYLLDVAFRRRLTKPDQMKEVEALCNETGRMLTALDFSIYYLALFSVFIVI
jgi:hypothetical protein